MSSKKKTAQKNAKKPAVPAVPVTASPQAQKLLDKLSLLRNDEQTLNRQFQTIDNALRETRGAIKIIEVMLNEQAAADEAANTPVPVPETAKKA